MIYSALVCVFRRSAVILVMLVISARLITAQTMSGEENAAREPGKTQPEWIKATEINPETDADWVRPAGDDPAIPTVGPQAIITLRAEALAIDLDAKARVLATLGNMNAENRLSPDDGPAMNLISFLATESYDFQVRRGGQIINDFPMIRAEAVRLLGSVGGPTATATLERVLNHEDDAYVLSQAVTAVARAAPESTPGLLRTLTTLVNHMNVVRRPDNALAIAVVNAVSDLHERFGGIDDPDLFRALLSIAHGGYSTAVRRAAVEVIDKLRRQTQPRR
ncbi:MAG: HEAT repeat domain-containing protein [Spirochaetia bacterium]